MGVGVVSGQLIDSNGFAEEGDSPASVGVGLLALEETGTTQG